MKALRAYYAAVAEAINAKDYELAALREVSTNDLEELHTGLQTEYGSVAPGPIPFVPLSVKSDSANVRIVTYCAINEGWTRDPKTGKPRKPRELVAIEGRMVKSGGRWLADVSPFGPESLCKGVDLPRS